MSNIEYMPHATDRISKGKIVLEQPLRLENGDVLPELEVAFTIYHSKGNTGKKIAVFHGLSSDSNLHEWWTDFPLEKLSDNYEVISLNILGSCFGTTGPESKNPKTGLKYLWSFPEITIRDMAEAAIRAFQALGYQKLDAVLGCSLGGMVAAEMFIKNSSFCAKTISVCAAEFSKIMEQLNQAQLEILLQSKENDYPEEELAERMRFARNVFRITCTTEKALIEFSGKLAKKNQTLSNYFLNDAREYRTKFSPRSYFYIMNAVNHYSPVASNVKLDSQSGEIVFVGIKDDWFITPESVKKLYNQFQIAGANTRYLQFNTIFGHEAWILDAEKFYEFIRAELYDIWRVVYSGMRTHSGSSRKESASRHSFKFFANCNGWCESIWRLLAKRS